MSVLRGMITVPEHRMGDEKLPVPTQLEVLNAHASGDILVVESLVQV